MFKQVKLNRDDLSKTCRFCMGTDQGFDELTPIFNQNGSPVSEVVWEILSLFIGNYCVIPLDGLPQKLCTICLTNFYSFHTFRNKCIDSQKYLQDIIIKTESDVEDEDNLKEVDILAQETLEDDFENNVEYDVAEQEEDKLDTSNTSTFSTVKVLTLEVSPVPLKKVRKVKRKCDAPASSAKSTKAEPKRTRPQRESSTTDEQRQKELCPDCGAFVNRLKEHMESHMGENRPRRYKCPHCERKFFNKSLFVGHVNKHSNIRPFQCPECDKSFHGKGNLRMHMNTHSTVNKYACHGCEKTFRYSHHLAQHRRIHTKEVYVCEHCNYSNAFIQNYRNHMMTHNSEPRFKCQVCTRGFNRKSYYLNHMKSYHPST